MVIFHSYVKLPEGTLLQWMINSSLLKMSIEIMRFPMKHGDLNHSHVDIYIPEGQCQHWPSWSGSLGTQMTWRYCLICMVQPWFASLWLQVDNGNGRMLSATSMRLPKWFFAVLGGEMQNCSSIVSIILYWGHVFPIISLYTPGGKPGKPGTFRCFNGTIQDFSGIFRLINQMFTLCRL